MRPNTPDPRTGLRQGDAPEEFARRAIIEALQRAIWTFGVDPNSILVIKLCQALGVEDIKTGTQGPRVLRKFLCAQCGQETTTALLNQKYCCRYCRRRVEHRYGRQRYQEKKALKLAEAISNPFPRDLSIPPFLRRER